MVPLERAMVVSNRLSIVTVALSVTIRPQFAIECRSVLEHQVTRLSQLLLQVGLLIILEF